MALVVINGTRMASRASLEAVHAHLKERFRFPAYYGKNLDALYDLLSTEDRHTLILFFDSRSLVQALGQKGDKLVETLRDVSLENHRLRLIFVERKERKAVLSRGRVV